MEIIVAPNAGICFGVKNALRIAEKQARGKRVSTLGPLIHNNQEIARLESLGIYPIKEMEEAGEADTVIIRSHGVGKSFYERYGERKNLVDATCPKVKVLHHYAEEYRRKGYQVVVYGDANHPEVIGILDWGGPASQAVISPEDLARIDFSKPILLLAQTTQSVEGFEKMKALMAEKAQDFVWKNTICSATRSRQGELAALAHSVDVMIVIGSPESSNSNKLYTIAKGINPETYFVETWQDLDKSWYIGKNKVGITAGASTPDWIIEEVIERMMSEDKMEKEQTMEELLLEMDNDIRDGDIVEGTVVQISKENLVVDIGLKAEGILSLDEYEGQELPAVGDTIVAVLIKKSNSNGQPVLSIKKLADRKAREAQREAMKTLPASFENKEELKGEVISANKAGLIVRIAGGAEGFLPASQIQVSGYAKNLEKFIGKEVRVRIIDLDLKKRQPKIVLSQKAILAEEREAQSKDFWENMEVGMVVTGTVKRITDFGAFVSLGYMDGLLHISELSWNKRENISKILAPGDEIQVKVIAIDKEKNKISLSLKALEEDPWVTFTRNHKPGHILKGTVTSVVDYGAFVNIAKMVEGLLHVSEISHEKVDKPSDVLKPGDEIEVEILDIDEAGRKVSLSKKSLDKAPVRETQQSPGKVAYDDDQGGMTLGDLLQQAEEEKDQE